MRSSRCAKTEQVHPLPANVSFAQGAAMGTPYATAYRGLLQRADAKPGETVLVHGASGGVGTAAVQLARARGLRVFGTAGSDEGLKLAREQGAHEVFDHRAPDHFEQIMKATGGRGVDVIVEMLANVNLGKDLTILAKGGRVVIIGSRGRVEIDPRDTMQRDADVRGMVLPNTPPAEMASIHAALVAGLENGTLRPVIGKEFPLAEAAEAHRAVMESGALGKIVLVPEKSENREQKRCDGCKGKPGKPGNKPKRRTGTELFRFAPDDVFVVTTVDQRVDFTVSSVTKQNSAFDTFAEEKL